MKVCSKNMFLQPKKEAISCIITGSGYVGNKTQIFELRIDQNVQKILRCWIKGLSEKFHKNYFSAI